MIGRGATLKERVDPKRSRMMASIRSMHTKPELSVRKALFAKGFRYVLHSRHLPGSPDLVFPRYRAVVLVHGCFWHRHEGCRYFRLPKTRLAFWDSKLAGNAARDRRDIQALLGQDWRVAVVWECATRHSLDTVTQLLARFLVGSNSLLEISS